MFRELSKLKDAERLLKQRRWAEVLSLVRDPEIREHKRAHDARVAARSGLLDEARQDLAAERIQAAGQKVRLALDDDAKDASAAELEQKIRAAASKAETEAKSAQRALREARWHDEHGDRGQARRLLEPYKSTEVASFVRRLEETESTERSAREGILSAIERGTSPDGLRARLREFRHAVKDKKLLCEVHGQALDAATRRGDPAELSALIADVRAGGIDAGDSLDRAAEALVAAARAKLERGIDPATVLESLIVFPAGSRSDPEGSRLKLACWAHGRARAMAARGHEKLAVLLSEEAAAGLPAKAAEAQEELAETARRISGILGEVEELVANRDWDAAKRLLEETSRAEPEALVLDDWSEALAAGSAELDVLFGEARAALDAGDLRKARRTALKLRIRGGRPADLAALADEISRRDEDAQRAAIDAERHMLRRGTASPHAALPPAPFDPMPDFSPAPGLILPGDPFLLRIENEGDWLVHPGQRLTIGNQANGEADLLVLAAIGARHAALERKASAGSGWRIVASHGQRVTRNGRQITEADLENGDRIQLGHSLTFTFHKPSPTNATAAIRLHGDFSIHGCTRLILFSESGRKGSILLAPGSDGHAPLRSVEARLEIFRTDQGEDAGELFARSPQGVAAGDAPERAQVRVRASETLSVGALRVHVDAVARRAL